MIFTHLKYHTLTILLFRQFIFSKTHFTVYFFSNVVGYFVYRWHSLTYYLVYIFLTYSVFFRRPLEVWDFCVTQSWWWSLTGKSRHGQRSVRPYSEEYKRSSREGTLDFGGVGRLSRTFLVRLDDIPETFILTKQVTFTN